MYSTPTKTIVASARAAHMARRGVDFRVDIDKFSINFDKVMERQNAIRNGNSKSLENWLADMESVDLYKAYVQFEDDNTIRIGDEVIEGDTIVVHTGARARTPSIPGLVRRSQLAGHRAAARPACIAPTSCHYRR